MIYEFKSRATGSVIMTQDIAEALLAAMGKTPGATGIITVEQLPAAIAALRHDLPADASDEGQESTDDDDDEPKSSVSLKQRAFPLIEMMETALKAGKDVTWGV
ncbi:MAG: DUF1840 domain-containing protein [Burkholderiaceae bacterium]